ncbi:MAG: DUF805 domain-containing protein [Pseudomonadota bacterium]
MGEAVEEIVDPKKKSRGNFKNFFVFMYSFEGRINLRQFILRLTIIYIIFFATVIPTVALDFMIRETVVNEHVHVLFRMITFVVSALNMFSFFVGVFSLYTRRLHDCGSSFPTHCFIIAGSIAVAFLGLFIFPGVVGLVLTILGCVVGFATSFQIFLPGTIGYNQYGPPPKTLWRRKITPYDYSAEAYTLAHHAVHYHRAPRKP